MQLALDTWASANIGEITHCSLLDSSNDFDKKYSKSENPVFMGFGGNKSAFTWYVLKSAKNYNLIIFGHINLAPLALLPSVGSKPCWLVAHGVEVWQPLTFFKRNGLQKMQKLLAVSQYTKSRLQSNHNLPPQKIVYFPNCLDPYLANAPVLPASQWNTHWRLDTGRTYLLTLARLSKTEQAKGYDSVIKLLPRLAVRFPGIAYLLAGTWNQDEYTRIRSLADSLGVSDRVLMPGFVPAPFLPAVFKLAKVFVMPSEKEGFGIVYLEAAWWGCPVIASNAGGAPEALLDGKLGTLVSPQNDEELFIAIENQLNNPSPDSEALIQNQYLIKTHFGFSAFCSRLSELLSAW